MKVLVIEDDLTTASYIIKGLKEKGDVVDHASNGDDGFWLASENSYDVLIIDRMLPSRDGLSILQELREKNILTPAIFLSALGSTEDRVRGLTAGGDDYLIKPFAFSELYARLASLCRRPPLTNQHSILKIADLEVDLLSHSVYRNNQLILLQPTEFRLLVYLMKNAGRILTRTMILEKVWDFNFDPKTSIVETHLSRLRSKMDKGFKPELIQTIRGLGYKLEEPK